MMKKLLLTVCMIAASAFSAFAQTVYSGFDIYGLESNKPQVKKVTHSIELGFGNEFQIGYRLHRNFNRYLTWDMLGFQYANNWGEKVFEGGDDYVFFDPYSEIALTTGVRGILPLKRSTKLFAALNLGYNQVWAEEVYRNHGYEEYCSCPGFLTDFSIGICFSKFSIAYGLQHVTGDFSHKDHVVRLAITF